jgi:hypothetical protein
VRTSPLVGRKAWFGPRRLGWGLGPISAEGWVATLLFSALAIATRQRKADPAWIRYVLVAAFLLLAVLKGTSPGGPRARADFEAASARGL